MKIKTKYSPAACVERQPISIKRITDVILSQPISSELSGEAIEVLNQSQGATLFG